MKEKQKILDGTFQSKKFKLTLILMIGVMFFPPWCTPSDSSQKIAGELIFQRKNIILRIRPVDYSWPSRTKKFELLMGHRWGSIIGYGYFKMENLDRQWVGLRIGLNTKTLSNRLHVIAQFRYFVGLNSLSLNHYYLIPALFFLSGKQRKVEMGFLGYEKKLQGKIATFLFGPAVIFPLTSSIKTRLYWGKNFSGPGTLLYLKFYYYL